MPTMGKVLTVLVTLVAIVWVILIAGVTELNKNGAKAVDAEKARLKMVEDDLTKEEARGVALRDQANSQQEVTGEVVAVIQARQAALEHRRSAALENASRLKFLGHKSEASQKNAELDRDIRKQEKADEEKALAVAKDEVRKLQGENQELMTQLDKLRNEFRETLRANKQKIGRTVE